MTERRVVNWSLKLGIQTLDARSPVGRHFLIVDSVAPYSCCLTDSFNLYFSPLKRALVASIAKVEGVVQEKFSPSYFDPPIKNPGGATIFRPKFSFSFPAPKESWFLRFMTLTIK